MRPSRSKLSLSSLLCVCLLAVPVGSATAEPRSPGRVLLVGNSLSRGIRQPLRRLLRDGGHRARIRAITPGGATLGDHVDSARTRRLITSRSWDYVVLQEQSSWMDQRRYPSARILDELIAGIGAETLFLMTWRDRGASLETYEWLRGTPDGLFGYVPIAFELDAAVAPVGWAIRNTVIDGLPYDLWRDGHHLDRRGRYLAACVVFATILGQSPVTPARHPGLDAAEAYYFQTLAADTALTRSWEWNIAR
jgi:hypothetical protein